MGKGRSQIDDWCPARDWVDDNQRMYRCSECNKRLFPREEWGMLERFLGYRLPPHKKKGWKIRRAKRRKLGGLAESG